MPDLTVHHLEHSRSHRILWFLEELGVPYGLKVYKRTRQFRAPPELEAVHPLGRAPLVTIGDVVLAESGAILEHLVDTLDGAERFRPEPGTEAHRRYRFFLHYAEGSLMPPLLVRLIVDRVRSAKLPFFVRPIAKGVADKVDFGYSDPEIKRHLAFLESDLGDREFLTGDALTAADIQLSYPLEAARVRGGLDETYPRLHGYLNRLRARPAYLAAIERGGPPVPTP